MTEAVKLITNYAFFHFDTICVMAFIFSKNYGSMRVLEKAGYVRQAVLKQTLIKGGEVMDEHIYVVYK